MTDTTTATTTTTHSNRTTPNINTQQVIKRVTAPFQEYKSNSTDINDLIAACNELEELRDLVKRANAFLDAQHAILEGLRALVTQQADQIATLLRLYVDQYPEYATNPEAAGETCCIHGCPNAIQCKQCDRLVVTAMLESVLANLEALDNNGEEAEV